MKRLGLIAVVLVVLVTGVAVYDSATNRRDKLKEVAQAQRSGASADGNAKSTRAPTSQLTPELAARNLRKLLEVTPRDAPPFEVVDTWARRLTEADVRATLERNRDWIFAE